MRLLVLGGTSEARRLAERLAGDQRFCVTVSLAGRTRSPRPLPVPTRVGGFGGIEGLAKWIETERIEAVVDATHPFAAQISVHAVAAAQVCGVPLGSIVRPAWVRETGDVWREVPDVQAGVDALPHEPCNVFLSVGRLELSKFAARPEHMYLARTIDPPGDISLPPNISFVSERGPFDVGGEVSLLRERGIDLVVSKNSGGSLTYPKITAARELGLPVIMVARPEKPTGVALGSIEMTMAWLDEMASRHERTSSERGV